MKIKTKNALIFFVALGLCSSRLFVQPYGEDTNGLGYIGYLLENIALFTVAVFYFCNFFNRQVFLNYGVVIWIVFYSYCIITSPFSKLPVLSLHLGIRGLLYVLLGIVAWEYIRRSKEPLKSFHYFLGLCFFIMSIVIFIEYVIRLGLDYVLSFGVGGSYIALLGLIYVYSRIQIKKTSKKYVWNVFDVIYSILLLLVVIKMNSLTAFFSFFAGFVFCLIRFFNVRAVFLFSTFIILCILFLLPMFSAGDFMIANKNIDTVRSGTGRFDTWSVCYEEIINLNIPFFGVGFLADGSILKSYIGVLELTHTCHSSLLSNIVGLGFFGFILYVLFILMHLFQIFMLKKSSIFRKYSVVIFSSLMVFGLASVVYPGTATLLISISVVLFLLNDGELSLK